MYKGKGAHHIDVTLKLRRQHLDGQVIAKGALPWLAHAHRVEALLGVLHSASNQGSEIRV